MISSRLDFLSLLKLFDRQIFQYIFLSIFFFQNITSANFSIYFTVQFFDIFYCAIFLSKLFYGQIFPYIF